MKTPFESAWHQFINLPSVNIDPLSQDTIAYLVFSAQFEIDLFEAGESELTTREVAKIRRFVAKWTPSLGIKVSA